MDLEPKDWITLGGVAVAAVASATNLWLQLKDRGDRYVLRYGALSPRVEPGTDLYVVNRSKHKIVMRDYGFILDDGTIYSIPYEAVENWATGGERYDRIYELEPGDNGVAGINWSVPAIAAYSMSSTERRPHLARADVFKKISWLYFQRLRCFALLFGMDGLYERARRLPPKHPVMQPFVPPPPPPA